MSAYVYRAFDCHGALLYIGSTVNPVERLRSHSSNARRALEHGYECDSVWFSYVGEINVKRFDTLPQARQAEAQAIFQEIPHFNIRGRNPLRGGHLFHSERRQFLMTGLHDCHEHPEVLA